MRTNNGGERERKRKESGGCEIVWGVLLFQLRKIRTLK
jgi:hypothetical protein